MEIIQIYANNMLKNFSYIIRAQQETYCIDPYDGKQIEKYLRNRGFVLTGIINTHQHHDHIRGNKHLLNVYGCRIVTDEKIQLMNGCFLERVKTPGHTPEHIVYGMYVNGKFTGTNFGNEDEYWLSALFCGDTLFNAGVGNCKNGGNEETLYHTITEIFYNFDKQASIYTGHDYRLNNLKFSKSIWPENPNLDKYIKLEEDGPGESDEEFRISTLEEEYLVNPFFNLGFFKEKFELDSEKEAFIYLRKLRDNW